MQKIWFKAKTYGWGWTPATWQGWLILGIFILTYVISTVRFTHLIQSYTPTPLTFIIFIIWCLILTSLLIWICYKTGEKPRWRWGK